MGYKQRIIKVLSWDNKPFISYKELNMTILTIFVGYGDFGQVLILSSEYSNVFGAKVVVC